MYSIQKKDHYVWIGLGITILLTFLVVYIRTQSPSGAEIQIDSDVSPVTTRLDPATLAAQESAYIEAITALVAAGSTIDSSQVESFLFETRVPYTFQSLHLEFAQSWAVKSDVLDSAGRAAHIIEYYQLVESL